MQPFFFWSFFTSPMRIDPKYFNVFIGIIAVISVIVIFYSTIRYTQNQVQYFEQNLADVRLDTLSFKSFTSPDSLRLSELSDQPLIIHFWSTWSSKSKDVNRFLHRYTSENQEIMVIAAVVRDDEQMVHDYIRNESYNFHYVEGTEFYQSVLVPGMPAQIMIGSGLRLHDTHIGDDTRILQEQLNQFLRSEDR